jgi:hypothetical protein
LSLLLSRSSSPILSKSPGKLHYLKREMLYTTLLSYFYFVITWQDLLTFGSVIVKKERKEKEKEKEIEIEKEKEKKTNDVNMVGKKVG